MYRYLWKLYRIVCAHLICLFTHFYDVYKKLYVNGGSCPCIHAVPAATNGLAQQPKPQRRPRRRGSPPQKTGVTQKGEKWECHLWFLEGKGVGRYYT
eukprot:1493421-Ditylum_brightwellii.AAC.1